MRIMLLLLFVLPLCVYAQEVETVKISKRQPRLFKGKSQEISDCYIYVDVNGMFYMASLPVMQREANQWFEKRKDSQNVYKAILQEGQYRTLTFVKETDPSNPLTFYFETREKSEIQLISMIDGRVYIFTQI